MTRTTGTRANRPAREIRRSIAVIALALCCGLVQAAEPPIGYVVEIDAIDALPLGPAESVAQDGLVRALDHPVELTLADGALLRFDANSAAKIARGDGGAWNVRVLSGRVRVIGPRGRTLVGGAGGWFTLPSGGFERTAGVERDDHPRDERIDDARRRTAKVGRR